VMQYLEMELKFSILCDQIMLTYQNGFSTSSVKLTHW